MGTYELPDDLVRAYKLTGRVDPILSRALGDQLPPLVEEPSEFASVIRARFAEAGTHNPPRLFVRLGGEDDGQPWGDDGGPSWAWNEFTDVEVLRVGVDGPPSLTEEEIDQQAATAQRNLRNETPAPYANTRRLKSCIEAWPDCVSGDYNPYCCRFPKSCSCDIIHSDERLNDPEWCDKNLEPLPVQDGS
jgi:hypothetical protein